MRPYRCFVFQISISYESCRYAPFNFPHIGYIYCGVFVQSVAKERLGKQISTGRLFSMRSASRTLLRNAEVNTSLRQLVDTQQ
jgi:hypothetical protein